MADKQRIKPFNNEELIIELCRKFDMRRSDAKQEIDNWYSMMHEKYTIGYYHRCVQCHDPIYPEDDDK